MEKKSTLKNLKEKPIMFSIIITTYKDKKYVNECLSSLYNQGLSEEDFELVIMNDASNDGTAEEVQSFLDKTQVKNARFFVNEENIGISRTRNRAIENTSGEYVVFIDGDDYLSPNGLSQIKDVIEKTKCDLVMPRINLFFEDENMLRGHATASESVDTDKINEQTGEDFFLACKDAGVRFCFPIVKREVLDKVELPFRDTLCEDDRFDWECYANCKHPQLSYAPYYNYRKRPDGRSRTNIKTICKTKVYLSYMALQMKKAYPDCANFFEYLHNNTLEYAMKFMNTLTYADIEEIYNEIPDEDTQMIKDRLKTFIAEKQGATEKV